MTIIMGNKCPRGCCKKFDLKTSITKKAKLLIWVTGGPCSGKTTQSQLLCEQFALAYVSPEAIIRECLYQVNVRTPNMRLERLHQHRIRLYNAAKIHERISEEDREFLGADHHQKSVNQLFSDRRQSDSEEEDDEYGPTLIKDIQKTIRLGKPIDPMIITALIKDVMESSMSSYNGFVLDSYPRDFDQATLFDLEIGEPHIIFHLNCSEEVMQERIVLRAAKLQRFDDNEFTIPFKFARYKQSTEPLLNYKRETLGDGVKFLSISGDRDVDRVASHIHADVNRMTGKSFKFKVTKELVKKKLKKQQDKLVKKKKK